jgi:UMF1 family MFS transporter
MRRTLLNAGVRKREAWAWAMYDFANSGYTTVVITAVFNAYFVAVVAGNTAWATLAWTAALAVSYVLIMLSAPAIGAYADLRSAKKRLLAVTTVGCVLGTAALALVGPGDLWLAVVLVVLSNFFFGTGENLIAAFLPELARGRALARLSGLGWGLGYLGGMLTLGLCLAYITQAQAAGLDAPHYVPGAMLITATVFLIAALPTFIFLRERATGLTAGGHVIRSAYRQVGDTLRHVRRYPDLFRFLLCIVSYQAGVSAVIALAAVYAQQAMGFDTRASILLILAVNVTAAIGATLFGYVQDRIGHKPAIALTLSGWLITVALAWLATDAALFWLAANVAGLCLGASQSAGRALVGYLSPLPHRAEFFGLWGLAVKLSAILGPITYGAAVWLTDGAHRPAMLTLGVFFLIGLAILAGVDVRRGRRQALQASKKRIAAGAPLD